ncbi:MAG: holo-ACP synthase [Treponema sp.]|jgi:holo-[acyl-carrier protein] synthase|nr:holo-ACP synthase [Treponema sp.]
MITGIGIDIVRVKRMEHWLQNPKLLERYFHTDELATARSRGNTAALTLAARFAAKEAFGKALGTGLADITLKDIMVVNKDNGQPVIKLFDSAQKAFEKSGAKYAHISLTHERDNAIAMIVLEGE